MIASESKSELERKKRQSEFSTSQSLAEVSKPDTRLILFDAKSFTKHNRESPCGRTKGPYHVFAHRMRIASHAISYTKLVSPPITERLAYNRNPSFVPLTS